MSTLVIKPNQTRCVFVNRGDPTLVKTNVAITTGYLISGKRHVQFTQLWFVKVSLTEGELVMRCDTLSPMCSRQLLIRRLKWFLSFVCIRIKCYTCTIDVLSSLSLYFCFPDLLLIFYYWKAIGDKFFVIHHLAALYAYYYVLVSALLSNSRTCRQDGKETTKGEQLCPFKSEEM